MKSPQLRRPAAVERDLCERGFTLEFDEWTTTARGDSADLVGVEAPLAVVRLVDGRPLSVVSAVANAADEGLVPVLVGDQQTRSAAESLLSEPFVLAGRRDGRRQFYAVEDRIRLTDDTFACVAADGEIRWSEASTTARAETPQLHLSVGGEVVAAFDSVDGLTCPGPAREAFRARYSRGDDGRFRVRERDGTVGRYGSVAAMRADGYRPVPLPLVPEHHLRHNLSLARATVLASVDGGSVTYSCPLTTEP
jgi:hypothetical protein